MIDGHHVFNPHTPFAGEVYSGLYRDDHSCPQYLRLPSCNPRSLMNFQPHAMSGGVRKIPRYPGLTQHLAGCGIHVAHAISRSHGVDCRLLRLSHGFIRTPRFPRNRTHPYSTGLVRTITIEYNTEVADHESTRGDRLLRGSPMWQRRP